MTGFFLRYAQLDWQIENYYSLAFQRHFAYQANAGSPKPLNQPKPELAKQTEKENSHV